VFIAAPLMTKKKLKCQSCGEFNDVGNAKPMKAAPAVVVASSQPDEVAALWAPDPTGHHELRYWNGTAWTEHVSTDDKQSTDPLAAEVERSSVDDVAAQIRKLAELRDDGLLTDEEFAQQKAKLLT
jgi:hypothetical protein